MATKLEDTIDKFSKYVADDENSVVAEAQQAAQSFRRLAEKLEGSLGDRADDLTMSAQRGMRQFELFMRDGRRLAESLDRVVRRLEQNPQQLLLGGSQVPEYNPSRISRSDPIDTGGRDGTSCELGSLRLERCRAQ